MIAVVAVTAAAAALGLAWHRRDPERALTGARRAMDLILWVIAPFVVVFTLPHQELTGGALGGVAIAWLVHLVCGLAAWHGGRRLLGLAPHQAAAMTICVVVANTGFFGFPVVKSLLGEEDLPAAIALDVLVTAPAFYVVAMAVGARFGTQGGRSSLRAVLGNPLPWATALGLALPVSASPDVLREAASAAVWALPALGFLALGVFLASEAREGALAFPPRLDAPVATVVALRMGVAPLLFLGLSAAIGGTPDSYRLEMAMPSGTSSLIVSHMFGLDLRITAGALTWTALLGAAGGLVASAL